jgi:hypothetical protein
MIKKEAMHEIFKKFKLENHISWESFILNKSKENFNFIKKKKTIYLDTNYWIYLGDALRTGVWKNDEHRVIYELLQQGINQNKFIVPGSLSLLFEVQKQNMKESKEFICNLIDSFSQGYSVPSKYKVIEIELENYLQFLSSEQTDLKLSKELIWRKGVTFIDDLINEDYQELAFNKSAYEIGENTSWFNLNQQLESNPEKENEYNDFLPNLATSLQRFKTENQNQYKSFKELQAIEILSSLTEALEINQHLLEKYKPYPSKLAKQTEYIYQNIIPTIYSYSSMHALMRFDKTRKYKDNDFYDLDHCAVALGYFDLLITENSFMNIIKNNLLKLDEKLNTAVIASPELAIVEIQKLL